MKLDPTARQIVADMVAEAHDEATTDGSFSSRAVASIVVDKLHDSQRFGHAWVGRYLHDLAVVGAMKVCADWRRAATLAGRTKGGKVVDLPAFAGKVVDGRPVQARFAGMDLLTLVEHRKRMSRTRNTLSTEIAVFDALIALMQANNLATVGEALAVMEQAA